MTTAPTRAELARLQPANQPAPKPTTSQNIDTAGSLIVLGGALTGLAFHAQNGPDLLGYPIAASLAATVIAAVVLVRTPPRNPR